MRWRKGLPRGRGMARLQGSRMCGALRKRPRLPADGQVRQGRALPGADLRRVSFVLFVSDRHVRRPELHEGRRLSGGLLRHAKVCWFTRHLQNVVPLGWIPERARMIVRPRVYGYWA